MEKFFLPIFFIGFFGMQVVILIFWKYINGRSNLNQERLQNLENNQNNNSNPEIEMVDLHKLQDELKKLNAEHQALFASEPLISLKDEKFLLRLQQLDLQNLDFSDSIKLVMKSDKEITRRNNHHKENLYMKILQNCKIYDALSIKTNSCKSSPDIKQPILS